MTAFLPTSFISFIFFLTSLMVCLPGCSLIQFSEDEIFFSRSAPRRFAVEGNEMDNDERAAALRFERSRIQNAISSGDLVMGMRMSDVRNAWGAPREIETAGNPRAGNQLWIYRNGLSASNGFGSTRNVYFEGGRVVGWDGSDH
jgi:hypothetical protein